MREYSASCDFRTEAVQVVVSHQRNMCDVKGYVTAIYEGAWWVACVTGTNPEMLEVTLSFITSSERVYIFTCVCMYGREG